MPDKLDRGRFVSTETGAMEETWLDLGHGYTCKGCQNPSMKRIKDTGGDARRTERQYVKARGV